MHMHMCMYLYVSVCTLVMYQHVSSRRLPMGLVVAYNESQMASGSLFWDDGESIGNVSTTPPRILPETLPSLFWCHPNVHVSIICTWGGSPVKSS